MDTSTIAPEPSSHDSTTRPDSSILTRKSTIGESAYLLEVLTHCGGPTNCTCPGYVLSGPEYPCLKRRIAKLQGIPYEPKSQMHKCNCGGSWRKPAEEDGEWWDESEDYLPPGSSDASSDSDDSGINADPENHPAESTEPGYKGGRGGPVTGHAIGADSEALNCEEHGGWKGNIKDLCYRCIEEHVSEPIYCEEHGGWEGGLKRLCDACKEVYGDPYLCTSDDCPYAATGHWQS